MISQHIVNKLSWVDVTKICLSNARACQNLIIFGMSRHSNRYEKGSDTHGTGWLCGGDQNLITESKMVVCTSNDPGGGAGISEQKFVMYRSSGRIIPPLVAIGIKIDQF